MNREEYFRIFDERVERALAFGDRDEVERLYEQALREGAIAEEELTDEVAL